MSENRTRVWIASLSILALVCLTGLGGATADPIGKGGNSSDAQVVLASRTSTTSPAPPPRTLAIIIPGTWSNEAFWPTIVPGRASFGSELGSALHRNDVVYPFLWASDNDHDKRMEGAKNLAALIDEKADQFDRICIVGFSHGGNLALWAASQCKAKIDVLIALATPHMYLKVKRTDGKLLDLPIYCPPETLKNVRKIVAVSVDTDKVDNVWASIFTGMEENEAIHMTRRWQEQENHPRLVKDDFFDRLFGRGNLFARGDLNAKGVANIRVASLVEDSLGVKQHDYIHSRRVGRLIGEMFRDGATDRQLDYMAHLIQPADSDAGGPISAATHRKEVERHRSAGYYEKRGWLLSEITVDLLKVKKDAMFKSDPYVRVFNCQGKQITQTPHKQGRKIATFRLAAMVPKDESCFIEVLDNDMMFDDALGRLRVEFDPKPPLSLETSKWSADLRWRAVHY